MRGKKSYNIRNIEAHLPSLQNSYFQQDQQHKFSRNMEFQTIQTNIIQPTVQQRQNEYINAQYGVSKYTSNLVSGKMFKKI
jgi:hypothetical protein